MKKFLLFITLAASAAQMSAQGFDNLPIPAVEEKVIDNTPDSIAKALMNRPAPGSTRQGENPVLFLIGNSTMRNGTMGNGSNGQWGWGYLPTSISTDGRSPWRIRHWGECLPVTSIPTYGQPSVRL